MWLRMKLVSAFLFAGTHMAFAADIYVNDASTTGDVVTTGVGSDVTGDGSVSTPYRTIQKAIDMAGTGDRIIVDAGTYNEDVAVSKAVTLSGVSAASVIILGPTTGADATLTISSTGVVVEDVSVTRDGNTVADWATNVKEHGLLLSVNGSVLRRVRAYGNINGVTLPSVRTTTIEQCSIEGNLVGVRLSGNTTGTIIRNSTISGNAIFGIDFASDSPGDTTSSISIHENAFSGNWYGDVAARWTSQAVLDVSRNAFAAAEPSFSVSVTVPNAETHIPTWYGGTAVTPNTDEFTIVGARSSNVDVSPFVDGVTDASPAAGFQPSTSSVLVHNSGAQSGSVARIREGIQFATAGATVRVLPGTYVGNVSIDKSVTLLSRDGRATTTIQGNSAQTGNGTILVMPGINNVRIGDVGQGFTILGIDGTPGIEKSTIYVQGNHTNCVIEDNTITAIGDAAFTTEFSATVEQLVLRGNTINGTTYNGAPAGDGFAAQFTLANVPRQLVVIGGGASTINTRDITFENNIVSGVSGGISTTSNTGAPAAAHPQGNTLVTIDAAGTNVISGNTFSGTTTRFAEALRMRGSGTYTVENNTFSGSYPANITAATTSPVLGITRAATIFDVVSGNTFAAAAYAENTNVIPTSIVGAVTLAASNGTVTVRPGTYAGNVTIDKPLSLLGSNVGISPNASDIVTANGSRVDETILTGEIIISASNVTVDGLTIQGAGQGVKGATTAAYSNIAVRNTIIGPTTGFAILNGFGNGGAVGASSWTLENLRISSISGNDRTAIVLFNVDGVEITGTYIDHSVASVGRRGMNIDGCSNVVISNNVVHMGATDFSNPSTTVFPSSRYAIQLSSSDLDVDNVSITNNEFNGSYSGVITLGNGAYTNINISGNTFLEKLMFGVRLQAGTNQPGASHESLTISNNSFVHHDEGTGGSGIRIELGDGTSTYGVITAENNSYLGYAGLADGAYAIDNQREDVNVSGECSWFGTTSGGAVTAQIRGNVDVSPFLVTGTNESTTRGFVPEEGVCNGGGPVTRSDLPLLSFASINDALNAEPTLPTQAVTVTVEGGTFNELPLLRDLDFTLVAINGARLSPGSYFRLGTDGITADNLVGWPQENFNVVGIADGGTVSNGVDLVSTGGVVRIDPGTYDGPITLTNKSVVLEGTSTGDDCGSIPATTLTTSTGFLVTSTGEASKTLRHLVLNVTDANFGLVGEASLGNVQLENIRFVRNGFTLTGTTNAQLFGLGDGDDVSEFINDAEDDMPWDMSRGRFVFGPRAPIPADDIVRGWKADDAVGGQVVNLFAMTGNAQLLQPFPMRRPLLFTEAFDSGADAIVGGAGKFLYGLAGDDVVAGTEKTVFVVFRTPFTTTGADKVIYKHGGAINGLSVGLDDAGNIEANIMNGDDVATFQAVAQPLTTYILQIVFEGASDERRVRFALDATDLHVEDAITSDDFTSTELGAPANTIDNGTSILARNGFTYFDGQLRTVAGFGEAYDGWFAEALVFNNVNRALRDAAYCYLHHRYGTGANTNELERPRLGGETGSDMPSMVAGPNPATTQLDVQFTAPTAGEYDVTLTNTLGHVVSTQRLTLAAYEVVGVQFDVQNLASGAYVVRVSDGTSTQSMTVIVQR